MPFRFIRLAPSRHACLSSSLFSYAAALILGTIALLEWTTASAALPRKLEEDRSSWLHADAVSPAWTQAYAEEPITPRQRAAAKISGSPFPGVIDHLLQRPLPGEEPMPGKADIHINYPSFGNRQIDADIREWVNGLADAFQSHIDVEAILPHSLDGDVDAAIDALNRGDIADSIEEDQPSFGLWGNYSVSRPSDAAVSITFELWNYTGSPQGTRDIITLNYNLINGQRLNFVDLFEKTDLALELMSSWSRKELANRPGASRRQQMLFAGTEPLVENFSSLTLTPEGICINFQPWQVAPLDSGIQKVTMPLEELLPSSPLLALWGK